MRQHTSHDERCKKLKIKSDDDVFNVYGIGIVSWFKLLRVLMKVYLLITIMILPVMYIYSQGNGLTGAVSTFKEDLRFTLGNLGFAASECIN
jgi:hypothetical protein